MTLKVSFFDSMRHGGPDQLYPIVFLCLILIKSYVIMTQSLLSNSLLIVIMLYN